MASWKFWKKKKNPTILMADDGGYGTVADALSGPVVMPSHGRSAAAMTPAGNANLQDRDGYTMPPGVIASSSGPSVDQFFRFAREYQGSEDVSDSLRPHMKSTADLAGIYASFLAAHGDTEKFLGFVAGGKHKASGSLPLYYSTDMSLRKLGQQTQGRVGNWDKLAQPAIMDFSRSGDTSFLLYVGQQNGAMPCLMLAGHMDKNHLKIFEFGCGILTFNRINSDTKATFGASMVSTAIFGFCRYLDMYMHGDKYFDMYQMSHYKIKPPIAAKPGRRRSPTGSSQRG